MKNFLWVFFQMLTPSYLMEYISRKIATNKTPFIKNLLIRHFIKKHNISLKKLKNSKIEDYPDFNSFFIRELKKEAFGKSNKNEIASPAEAKITEFGTIEKTTLFQSKKNLFTLEELLVKEKKYVDLFKDGQYMIFFLDVNNYHRYHMPWDGKLEYSIYIPGRSFELDPLSQQSVPKLYCKNERYIAFFDTDIGKIAMILVGALYVGGIQLEWMKSPFRSKTIKKEKHTNMHFKKNDEFGCFKYGSTIILLFEKDSISWKKEIKNNKQLKVQSAIARVKK